MTWWMWIGIALVLAVLVFNAALRSFRRGVRRQLLEQLRAQYPDVEVVREDQAELQLRFPGGGSGTLGLANLYQTVARGPRDPDVHRETIRTFVNAMVKSLQELARPLSLATDGDRLMPRLATASMARQAASSGTPLVQRETSVPGLLVLYVLDSEDSVRYLGEPQLSELGIDVVALHERAIANLARHPIAEIVRDVVERKNAAVVKLGGSYDATRLLLVADALLDGEEVVAVIPDRETLALVPVPPEDGWDAVRKLARIPASPYLLLDQPLRVTRTGFALA